MSALCGEVELLDAPRKERELADIYWGHCNFYAHVKDDTEAVAAPLTLFQSREMLLLQVLVNGESELLLLCINRKGEEGPCPTSLTAARDMDVGKTELQSGYGFVRRQSFVGGVLPKQPTAKERDRAARYVEAEVPRRIHSCKSETVLCGGCSLHPEICCRALSWLHHNTALEVVCNVQVPGRDSAFCNLVEDCISQDLSLTYWLKQTGHQFRSWAPPWRPWSRVILHPVVLARPLIRKVHRSDCVARWEYVHHRE
mmetsp:Transcript_40294/g.95745  ORF Transcript_40294/g.95745 Transcript_40294/m.95745 type:complete len:256 (+) Transcript_40294:75-842(+)